MWEGIGKVRKTHGNRDSGFRVTLVQGLVLHLKDLLGGGEPCHLGGGPLEVDAVLEDLDTSLRFVVSGPALDTIFTSGTMVLLEDVC